MEERRLILAFALSFAVLLGFRLWTNSRYPQPAAAPVAAVPADATPMTSPTQMASPAPPTPPSLAAPTPQTAPTPALVSEDERRVEVVTSEADLAFSTKGARLLSWRLPRYHDDKSRPLAIHPSGEPNPGPLDLLTDRADVNAKLRTALFRATETSTADGPSVRFDFSDGSIVAWKTLESAKDGRTFRIQGGVTLAGQNLPARVYWGPGLGQPTAEEKSLTGYLPPGVVEIDENGNENRLPASGLSEPRSSRVRLAGIESKYFAAIFARDDGSTVNATARAEGAGKEAQSALLVEVPVLLTIGAKDYDRLQALGLGAEKVVPVGSWLGPIVVPLTRALRAVNDRVGNYGLAIVLLTIGIALLLSPLRHYAILSSAKMAKVAPQIRAVQERYKRLSLTDPKRQQMQQEIAEVYEKNGIDMVRQTAAGCLPTLLTMPLLFAFYRMLDLSVDLKGAPFFWIPDLALKDPLFVMPLLSGLSMIAMQKLMPAPAMDPAQQRMMLLIPVIFAGAFAWAPAGLNLYWFVSNLAAMAQQALAMYFAPHLFPRAKPAQS